MAAGVRRGGAPGGGGRAAATVRPAEGEAARERRRPGGVGPPVGGGRRRGRGGGRAARRRAWLGLAAMEGGGGGGGGRRSRGRRRRRGRSSLLRLDEFQSQKAINRRPLLRPVERGLSAGCRLSFPTAASPSYMSPCDSLQSCISKPRKAPTATSSGARKSLTLMEGSGAPTLPESQNEVGEQSLDSTAGRGHHRERTPLPLRLTG